MAESDITSPSWMTLVSGGDNNIQLIPKLHDVFDIKHKNDDTPPDPVDITVMNVKGQITVIIADFFNNKCLKSIYTSDGRKVISVLKLSHMPSQLAKVTENMVATLSDSYIIVAEVRPELKLAFCVKTSKQYISLASLPDSILAAGSLSPSAIDILDLSGNVLKSVTPENTGLNLIERPHYLCATGAGHIMVTDDESKSIYCLTSDGDVVFSYIATGDTVEIRPRGIAVTHNGDILVADSSSDRIILITADRKAVHVLLSSADGIDNPWGLCSYDNKLYVCQRSGGNCIKVFTFS